MKVAFYFTEEKWTEASAFSPSEHFVTVEQASRTVDEATTLTTLSNSYSSGKIDLW